MIVVILILVGVLVGLSVAAAARRWPTRSAGGPRPGVEAARAAGEAAGRHPPGGAARAAYRPRGGDGIGADARAGRARRRGPRARRAGGARARDHRRRPPRPQRRRVGPRARDALLGARPEGVHRPRVPGRGRRAGGTARRRRDRTVAEPVGHPVPRRGRRRQRCAHDHGQAPGRPRAADARPDRGHARAVVPERPLVVLRGVLRGRRAHPRPAARPAARAPASPGRPPGWRRRSRRAASCSTPIGSATSSPASRSAGRGSRRAASRSAGACCASALPPRSRSTRRPRHHATGPRRAAAPRPAEGPARGGDRRRDPSSRPRASRPLSCSAASG